jgi:hypothetical protein
MNIEENQHRLRLQKIALGKATETLRQSGIDQDNKFYAIRLYEMQFAIYTQLKLAHNLKDE